jgi:hypothetical protein
VDTGGHEAVEEEFWRLVDRRDRCELVQRREAVLAAGAGDRRAQAGVEREALANEGDGQSGAEELAHRVGGCAIVDKFRGRCRAQDGHERRRVGGERGSVADAATFEQRPVLGGGLGKGLQPVAFDLIPARRTQRIGVIAGERAPQTRLELRVVVQQRRRGRPDAGGSSRGPAPNAERFVEVSARTAPRQLARRRGEAPCARRRLTTRVRGWARSRIQSSGPTGSSARAATHGWSCSKAQSSMPTSRRRPRLPRHTSSEPRRASRSASPARGPRGCAQPRAPQHDDERSQSRCVETLAGVPMSASRARASAACLQQAGGGRSPRLRPEQLAAAAEDFSRRVSGRRSHVWDDERLAGMRVGHAPRG